MSNLPISSKYRSTPERPVPDAERDDLNKRLNEAFAAGRIDEVTYRELLDRVYGARTLGELVPVVEVLPVRQTFDGPQMVHQSGPPPGEVTPARPAGKLAYYAAGGIAAGIVLLGLLIALIVL